MIRRIAMIANIDKNFNIDADLGRDDIVWFDVCSEPFRLYGVTYSPESGRFIRMPEKIAEKVNEGVAYLNKNTAGGRVRFSTDSPFIAIKAKQPYFTDVMSHMTRAGKDGFDVFKNVDGEAAFVLAFIPSADMEDGITQLKETGSEGRMTSYTMNFPLYGCVDSLYIGLKEGSRVDVGAAYKNEKPIVYYGSSITQGGCASRPGNCYQALVSQKYNLDYINLGFSGSCRAEIPMAEYLASLDMDIFVCDYDHNTPSVEYLAETHGRLYDIIRAKQPDLPYVMISKPDWLPIEWSRESNAARRNVIFETFIRAKRSGDKNVYFIDGERLFDGDFSDCCTVDGCHPNDLGFYRMSRSVGETIKKIYENKK